MNRLPKGKIPTEINPRIPSWNQVPLLNWEQAVVWPKMDIDDAECLVSTDIDVGDNAFALTIKDSTMMPRFPEGTVVIIDPLQSLTDRDFAAIHIQGNRQVTFKQLLIDGEDTYIKPLNPDFTVTRIEKPFTVLGVMVQARMDFKDAS